MENRFLIIVFLIPFFFSGCGQEGSLYLPAEQTQSKHQYDVFLLQKTPATPGAQVAPNPQTAAPDAPKPTNHQTPDHQTENQQNES